MQCFFDLCKVYLFSDHFRKQEIEPSKNAHHAARLSLYEDETQATYHNASNWKKKHVWYNAYSQCTIDVNGFQHILFILIPEARVSYIAKRIRKYF